MASVKMFDFKSSVIFEDDIQEISFLAKGVIDEEKNIIYFKNENNAYKFILGDTLEVFFNDSKYMFELNKKTLAYVNSEGFTFNTSVYTTKLEISLNQIYLEYEMDFNSFKGKYSINLMWH